MQHEYILLIVWKSLIYRKALKRERFWTINLIWTSIWYLYFVRNALSMSSGCSERIFDFLLNLILSVSEKHNESIVFHFLLIQIILFHTIQLAWFNIKLISPVILHYIIGVVEFGFDDVWGLFILCCYCCCTLRAVCLKGTIFILTVGIYKSFSPI